MKYALLVFLLNVAWACSQTHAGAGIIEMHVHMTGGGGEAGPASRCPEAQVRSTGLHPAYFNQH